MGASITDPERSAAGASKGGGAPTPGAAAVVVVTLYTAAVYAPSLWGLLLRCDDLWTLGFVRDHGPLAALIGGRELDALWFGRVYFRPISVFQMWACHELFGLAYAGYQAIVLAEHVLAAIAMLLAAARCGASRGHAVLIALLFASHNHVSPLVTYVSDTAVLTNLVAVLVAACLARPLLPSVAYVLPPLLFLAPLTRENGAAIVAAAGCCGAYLLAGPESRRAGRTVLLACLAGGSAYLLLRAHVSGVLPQSMFPVDVVVGNTRVTSAEVAALALPSRLALHGYVVLANVASNLFPVFRDEGGIDGRAAILVAVLGLLAASAAWLLRSGPRRWRESPAGIAGGAVGLLAVALALLARDASLGGTAAEGLRLARVGVHAALSLLVLVTLPALWRRSAREGRAALVFALALLLASSAVAFPYFRIRNLNLGAISWLLLLAMAVARFPFPSWRVPVLRSFLVLGVLAALVTGARVATRVPPLESRRENARSLCDPKVPEDLALDLAERYGLDVAAVRSCRVPGPGVGIRSVPEPGRVSSPP